MRDLGSLSLLGRKREYHFPLALGADVGDGETPDGVEGKVVVPVPVAVVISRSSEEVM